MAANLTAYDAVLKEDYAPAIVEQLKQANILLQRIERDEESVEGKEVYVPLHTKRNVGIGARGENETLPTAGAQGYSVAKFPVRFHYGRIEVSGPLLAASRSNKGSFVRALDAEIQGMANDFRKDINRALYGDGTGRLAKCGSMAAAGTTIPVDSLDYLDIDMVVDIYHADGTTLATGRKITAIDPDSDPKTITVDGTDVQTAATDIVVRSGAYDRELHGLEAIVNNTGTLQNIDSSQAANRFWRATVLDNGGTNRSLSEVLMQTAFDAVEDNDGRVTLMVCDYGVRRAYLNLLTSLKRFSNTLELEGGWKALDFNGKPLVVDPDCPGNLIYYLDERHLKFYQMNDPSWAEEDGAVLHRVSGKDAYEAFYFWYVEFGTDKRRVHAVLKDITEA